MAEPEYDKKPAQKEPEILDVLKCTVRLDTTMNSFERKGGVTMFVDNLSYGMGIDKRSIKVRNIREGSVIVDYDIMIDESMPSKSEIGKR